MTMTTKTTRIRRWRTKPPKGYEYCDCIHGRVRAKRDKGPFIRITVRNPNDCAEVRWGAPPKSEELKTCERRAPEEQRKRMLEYRHWFQKRYSCG